MINNYPITDALRAEIIKIARKAARQGGKDGLAALALLIKADTLNMQRERNAAVKDMLIPLVDTASIRAALQDPAALRRLRHEYQD